MIAKKRFQLVAFAVTAVVAITAFLLGNTLSSSAESNGETATLEEGGNINWALLLARKGRGPTLVGDPTAIYGKIMTYSDAVAAAGVPMGAEGASVAWRLDRPVHLYVFEGNILDSDPRTSHVDDWAQKIIIIDEARGHHFGEITHRLAVKVDVSEFLPLSIRDDQKDVPHREIENLRTWPTPVPAAPATPAPSAPAE